MHPTHWRFRHRDASGLLLAETGWIPNVLCYEGEQLVLGSFFRNDPAATPLSFQLGLVNMTPAATTTMFTLQGEPTSGGYQRISIPRTTVAWPSLFQVGGGANPFTITMLTQTFTAIDEPITPFSSGFLAAICQTGSNANQLTPFLVCAASTGATNSIDVGNSVEVTLAVTLST